MMSTPMATTSPPPNSPNCQMGMSLSVNSESTGSVSVTVSVACGGELSSSRTGAAFDPGWFVGVGGGRGSGAGSGVGIGTAEPVQVSW